MNLDLLDALATITGRTREQLEAMPRTWDEGEEARILQIAESWDDETRTYRRLSPRKDHR